MPLSPKALIDSLVAASHQLDEYVRESSNLADTRKRMLNEHLSGSSPHLEYNIEAASKDMLEVRKALTRFELANKNAENILAKMEAQARKDLETIARQESAGVAALKQLILQCHQISEGIRPTMQKAGYPPQDMQNLFLKIMGDKKVPPILREKFASIIGQELREAIDALYHLVNLLNMLASDVEAF